MKSQSPYLEHANITVNDIDELLAFLQLALPEYKIRGGGEHNGRKWVHIGTEETYLALNEATVDNDGSDNRYTKNGLNHLGFVVEDVESVAQRLEEKGYKRSYPKTVQKFRIRDYFYDKAGNEYEFVQYLSDKPEERNDYSE